LSTWPFAEDYMCAHGAEFQFSCRVCRTLAYTYALKRMTGLWFNSASEERPQPRILAVAYYMKTRGLKPREICYSKRLGASQKPRQAEGKEN
jgi:hypothetical protein